MLTTARNATLEELHGLLSVQHDVKHDAVIHAHQMHYSDGTLIARGMGLDGPAGAAGEFTPTEIFDGHLAGILDIPLAYLRRMRKERLDLLDLNVNGWLRGDQRRFFVRTFLDHENDSRDGIARALLSDRYRRVDHLDVVTSVLDGIRATGVDARVADCQLTERRLQMKVVAPQIATMAEKLLAGYRDPFEGPKRTQRRRQWSERTGIDIDSFGDGPVVFAGFVVTNSETGNGAAAIWPQITIARCLNGQTFATDVLRNVHLGGRLDEGVVTWSDETQQKNLELITSMTRDAVITFLDRSYVDRKVAELEETAEVEITGDINSVVELVGATMRYSKEQTAGILNHFIRGGQVTAGGIMQAVTSFAQEIEDPDEAWELEASAQSALTVAAVAASRGR